MRWWMRKENIFDLESIYNIGEYMTFHCHIHIFFRGYIKLISTNQITSENRQADLDLHAFSWHLLSFGMWRKNRHKKRRLKSLILVEFGLASPIQLIWCPASSWVSSICSPYQTLGIFLQRVLLIHPDIWSLHPKPYSHTPFSYGVWTWTRRNLTPSLHSKPQGSVFHQQKTNLKVLINWKPIPIF